MYKKLLQVDCCKKMFTETKQKTQTSKKEQVENKNNKEQKNANPNKQCKKWEHDRSNKPILFVNKYSMCNFSTFDTTCVNHQQQYKNEYPPANIKI
jgi:hypothetical protein